MERPCKLSPVVSFVVVLLSLVAFTTCIAAEFEKNKGKDLKLDGRLCSLPESPAFGLGITASICLSIAQIVGTSFAGIQLCSRKNKPAGQTRRTATPISLMVLSWISFGLAIILLGASSSMNSRQPYGKGWLDGNCYVVKDGVYSGAAVLVVVTMIFILGFKRSMRSNTVNRVMTEDG
ncbi:hypothetical protein QJS04_geneDACA012264 [Acorus gramineus]|uniref:Uncharacterized protein n=1 Tax=Acorus gramineus TaxID=55184 RepID=A0AAV9BDT2_ACOGR|nr:hypothetical protein QJS04_geneDACA012264 [Acorus gramineus]